MLTKWKIKAFDLKNSSRRQSELDPATTLIIYDTHLDRVSPEFRKFRREYRMQYGVRAGESLKSLRAFPKHFEKLASLAASVSPKALTILAVGGGSVGDFAGFFASVYKRGVRFVQMPSTWLAAIDSAHGGKTALNNAHIKNQLGTFYPADVVYLNRSLLFMQPDERAADAMGELAKIAIIDGGSWVQNLESSSLAGSALIWRFLKDAIAAKNAVVAQDPFEKSGVRQVLNFGHTVGHVFEAYYRWSHGHAVTQGLFFAIDWALERGDLRAKDANRMLRLLTETMGLAREMAKPIPILEFRRLLNADKKKSDRDEVVFLVPVGFGRVRRKSVSINSIVLEARRQGWVR